MATQGEMTLVSIVATGVVEQYQFVGYDGAVAAAGAQILGSAQTDAPNGNETLGVAVVGRVKAKAEGAITQGDEIAVGAAGGAAVAVATNAIIGVAATDAATGEFVTLDLGIVAPVKA